LISLFANAKRTKKEQTFFAKITVDGEIKEQIDTTDWINKQEIVKSRSIEVKAINDSISQIGFL